MSIVLLLPIGYQRYFCLNRRTPQRSLRDGIAEEAPSAVRLQIWPVRRQNIGLLGYHTIRSG